MKMKEIKTLELKSSSSATLGGTPYDVIVNGKCAGTIAVIDEDDMLEGTIKILVENNYSVNPYEVADMLGIEL